MTGSATNAAAANKAFFMRSPLVLYYRTSLRGWVITNSLSEYTPQLVPCNKPKPFAKNLWRHGNTVWQHGNISFFYCATLGRTGLHIVFLAAASPAGGERHSQANHPVQSKHPAMFLPLDMYIRSWAFRAQFRRCHLGQIRVRQRHIGIVVSSHQVTRGRRLNGQIGHASGFDSEPGNRELSEMPGLDDQRQCPDRIGRHDRRAQGRLTRAAAPVGERLPHAEALRLGH